MVKLLKYEMKKQQTSRMVIGSILLVCVLGFALGMLLGREKLAAVSLAPNFNNILSSSLRHRRHQQNCPGSYRYHRKCPGL